jgi:hypothetical protein
MSKHGAKWSKEPVLVPAQNYYVKLELNCIDVVLVELGLSLLPEEFKTERLLEYIQQKREIAEKDTE